MLMNSCDSLVIANVTVQALILYTLFMDSPMVYKISLMHGSDELISMYRGIIFYRVYYLLTTFFYIGMQFRCMHYLG